MNDNKKPERAKQTSRKISLSPISKKKRGQAKERKEKKPSKGYYEATPDEPGFSQYLSWGTIKPLLITAFFPPVKQSNPVEFFGRAVVFVVLVLLTADLIFASIPELYPKTKFMHLVNLPFHEAGHIFFAPFGRLMRVFGGSLLQVLIPLIVMFVFLFKTRDAFGAAVALWWTAESLMDVAVYINDARAGELMLLGGSTGKTNPLFHDWRNLLLSLGWIRYDTVIASYTFGVGKLLMLVSVFWGGLPLWIYYKSVKNTDKRPDDFD